METKVCSKCGKELPISEFYKSKRTKDGLFYKCIHCVRIEQKESRERSKNLKEIGRNGGKKLSDYTPRELMEELHRRGYRGTLEFTEIHKINISDF